MEHVAIDLGGRESQICVRNGEGKIIEERRWSTASLAKYLRLRPPSVVVMETCSEAFDVAAEAAELGHQVRVVPASLAPSLGVGARRTKTDRRDAQVLSEVSTRIDLPGVHIPSLPSRRAKSLCTARSTLVKSRTQLVNAVRGALRTHRMRVRLGTDNFAQRVRTAQPDLPGYLLPLLTAIEQLTTHIKELDAQVAALAKKHPVCPRLMTIPGVGPLTALRFVATIDDVSRFPSAHKLQAYLGLTPGEDSSSDHKRRTNITKAGPTMMRWLLVQAAWCVRRTRGEPPLRTWSNKIELRRGKGVAVVALARKLAGIMYALWRDGTVYDPSQTTSSEPSS
jgi:transposase